MIYIYSGCIYLPSASQNFTVCFLKKIIAYLIWLNCNLMVGNKILYFEEVLQTIRWQVIDRYAVGTEKQKWLNQYLNF